MKLAAYLVAVLFATPALAQAPAAKAPAPVPAKELEQIRVLEGHWTCEGQAPESPMGPAHKTKAAVKMSSDLDGFWYSGLVEQEKTPENPRPMKGRFHWTYDTAAKAFKSTFVDNSGGWATQSSAGWKGDTLTFEGDMIANGKKTPARDVFVKKSDSEILHSIEAQIGGKWTKLGDETCKRREGKGKKDRQDKKSGKRAG
jgi:hypothetical protein